MWQRIQRIFASIGEPDCPVRPTDLFEEGWMLRLLLDDVARERRQNHPFAMADGARWFAEALLRSPFLARYRGDPLAEGWTNADAAVGHFHIGERAKGDLSLRPDAQQFIVIEAKMLSGLSPGVKRCPIYDQASRTVACIAELLAHAKIEPATMASLAVFVVAPAAQISAGVFGERVTKQSIERAVRSRVDTYAGARDRWFRELFEPTLERIEVSLISWEDVLRDLPDELQSFYEQCLHFNQRAPTTGGP